MKLCGNHGNRAHGNGGPSTERQPSPPILASALDRVVPIRPDGSTVSFNEATLLARGRHRGKILVLVSVAALLFHWAMKQWQTHRKKGVATAKVG